MVSIIIKIVKNRKLYLEKKCGAKIAPYAT